MTRSHYHDDVDNWAGIRWRGMVASAIRGKRGQQCLIDLRDALDAMPNKRLIAGELEDEEGEVCALGQLGKARKLNIDMRLVDVDDPDTIGMLFNIAPCLAQEIVYYNDEYFNYANGSGEELTPEERWTFMHKWVDERILKKA